MCAIVDANVAGEVFGEDASPAGREFFNWLNGGRGRLVVGGKLLDELEDTRGFTTWASAATLAGRLTTLSEREVEARTRKIEREAAYSSNDPHVLAVAQIGNARLLFTNDQDLGLDFRRRSLIDRPRGRIYHTRDLHSRNDNKGFSKAHKRLLRTNVCRS